MMATDHQNDKHLGKPMASSISSSLLADKTPVMSSIETHHLPRLWLDVALCGVFLVASAAGCIPIMWGLALHQYAFTASGICFSLAGVLVVINRLVAPPAARQQRFPCLGALTERPWVLLSCLLLVIASFILLFTSWPRLAS
jgi:hypothetical protein